MTGLATGEAGSDGRRRPAGRAGRAAGRRRTATRRGRLVGVRLCPRKDPRFVAAYRRDRPVAASHGARRGPAGSLSRGTANVVSARTCRTSPETSGALSCSHGCSARKSASPLGARSVPRRGGRGGARRRGRGRVAEDRELGLDRGDEAPRALDAGAAAEPRGRADRVVQLDEPGRRVTGLARQGRPGRAGFHPCVAWTSSWKRAANSGVASSEQTAGQANVQPDRAARRRARRRSRRGRRAGARPGTSTPRPGPARRSRRPRAPRRRRPRRRRRRARRSAGSAHRR